MSEPISVICKPVVRVCERVNKIITTQYPCSLNHIISIITLNIDY